MLQRPIQMKRALGVLVLVVFMNQNAVAFSSTSLDTSASRVPASSLRPRVIVGTTTLRVAQRVPNLQVKPNDDFETKIEGSDAKSQRTNTVLATFAIGLSALGAAAKAGLLNGPMDVITGSFGDYTDIMIARDIESTVLTSVLAFFAVKVIGLGYEKGLYNSKISRKLTHTFLAPAFMLTYPIFSPADGARFFAFLVTFVNGARLYLAATSEGESSLAKSVSRSGDKAEALGGPFIYVCLLSVFILAFWRSSMIGVVAASTMAAGDGMADLVGRRFGKNNKWWFSESKSIAGTIAFVVFASITSFGLVNWLDYTGCLHISLASTELAFRIFAISAICSVVELIPVGDDNFTVPITAAILAALLLQ